MLKHYLTVAFRNLRKYKTQSVISVIGLAVGFTCFALASLWIRYEMTYDTFHKKADRIYMLDHLDKNSDTGIATIYPHPLAAYMKETFPEIANASNGSCYKGSMTVDGAKQEAYFAIVDAPFLEMFDIQILEGSKEFMIPESGKVAITREKAKKLFGAESPLGKSIKQYGSEYTICALVSEISRHSNYFYEIISTRKSYNEWNVRSYQPLIELGPGVDVKAFKEKIFHHVISQKGGEGALPTVITELIITPLKEVRYNHPNTQREVKFEHIFLFLLAGGLVVLCSLFNYFTLFISRFRIREKELALRMVCGASGKSLFALLSVEFLITLLIASLLGMIFMKIFFSPFQTLSEISMGLSAIYEETLLYMAAVILLSMLTFLLILWIFRKRSLNTSIRKSNKNRFRKVSIVLQLIISAGFIFCTIVMIKQLYHLHYSKNLGFEFHNTAYVGTPEKTDVFVHHFEQTPEITETLIAYSPLIPATGSQSTFTNSWDDKPEGAEGFSTEEVYITEKYLDFYQIQLISGEWLSDSEPKDVLPRSILINESAAKAFGWDEPVGKCIGSRKVKGVIKNIYKSLPTVPVKPTLYLLERTSIHDNNVIFKYREGQWETVKEKIEALLKEEYPEESYFNIGNANEAYEKYLSSENALMKILGFVSIVCMLICVFGFVSLISLTCEERRKEIAIRKINGATIKNILAIFIKEYTLLLVIGTAIAFPIGYHIMKRWLEQYILQTTISCWIYISIIAILVVSIVLCIGWRVYKASIENPAEVIKTE